MQICITLKVISINLSVKAVTMSSMMCEYTINQVFADILPISPVQRSRLSRVSVALLLASHVQLPRIASWVSGAGSRDAHIQVVRRLFDAPLLEVVWIPFVTALLHSYQTPTWHLVMDRTSLGKGRDDLLLISLSYRGRALPLVWERLSPGCTSSVQQIALWERVLPLLPANRQIIAQGDTEFGAVAVMRWMRDQDWFFLLAQQSNTYYRPCATMTWQYVGDLQVSVGRTRTLAEIEWTQQHCYGPLNLCAFHYPHQNGKGKTRYKMRYVVTNLPTTCRIRTLGRHRFRIECFFKDMKSSGWQLEDTLLHKDKRLDNLLILTAMLYWWTTCVGRWVCKTGQRHLVDGHSTRHLSLFHIGREWLIREYREGRAWQPISILYS